ncbi:ArsR/SmtB family transcription factor [Dongia soli]|uniref:Metalloregulator ArsR/SmtB family transcription factor n=1 Tax=Dongia soli TaxID=600628 RepID=A0ABU5E8S7_9PROT|nr:metalloregulator ArsR/SmtB family transcription factor [Dongia soli]MDY0882736.1 metalloregulator ArsR/SmtB family transcription factor [Dongia soli]
MDDILKGLRAAAEPTRLRILGLCAHAELTVSDLCDVLGQSQPRISRHLKLLVEANLLQRNQEGPWAWYRLPEGGAGSEIARLIVDLLPPEDRRHSMDLERLESISEGWATRVADYFRQHAGDWEHIRALHTDQERVDKELMAALSGRPIASLLDIGTGAGHVLLLLAAQVPAAIGIDRSREMLQVARHNLFRAGHRHCQVRQADMMTLPFDKESFDAVTLNMVLHFADRPDAVLGEAARVLRPGGQLVVVDFATHELVALREEQAHRWLGFGDSQIADWYRKAGLVPSRPRHLTGGELTVVLWSARRPANDAIASAPASPRKRNAKTTKTAAPKGRSA